VRETKEPPPPPEPEIIVDPETGEETIIEPPPLTLHYRQYNVDAESYVVPGYGEGIWVNGKRIPDEIDEEAER